MCTNAVSSSMLEEPLFWVYFVYFVSYLDPEVITFLMDSLLVAYRYPNRRPGDTKKKNDHIST